jgi:hypothetical protein
MVIGVGRISREPQQFRSRLVEMMRSVPLSAVAFCTGHARERTTTLPVSVKDWEDQENRMQMAATALP